MLTEDEAKRFAPGETGNPRSDITLAWELVYRLEPELYERLVAAGGRIAVHQRLHAEHDAAEGTGAEEHRAGVIDGAPVAPHRDRLDLTKQRDETLHECEMLAVPRISLRPRGAHPANRMISSIDLQNRTPR